jgi:hypothetical protein
MPSKKNTLIQYLEQEAQEAHNAETFSRNGESTDFDDGEFSGRETLAKELIDILKNGCKFEKINGRIEPWK